MEKIQNDFDIGIATAHSRLAKKWKNRTWKWSELVGRCSRTQRNTYEQIYNTILCDGGFNSLYRKHGQLRVKK